MKEISDEFTQKAGVKLFILRTDLVHPTVSGNKWFKLKYNLIAAEEQTKGILTFGGAYSNHIYATAAAGKEFNIPTIGIIRGEELEAYSNPTLRFAKECGMQLVFVDRDTYKLRADEVYLQSLKTTYPNYLIVPEGGSNSYALKGCQEIIEQISIPYNYLCCAAGTGGTLAGILGAIDNDKQVLGFPALKGGDFLLNDINKLLRESGLNSDAYFELMTDYHFGGYAKTKPELVSFINSFESQHQIPLEQVYTGKMMFGIYDLLKKGYFKKGKTIIAIHTGGLQGRNLL